MQKQFALPRAEKRVPMTVAVQLEGDERVPGVEATFTQNVSARGARVLTAHRWETGACLEVAMLPAGFHARARVAYCKAARSEGFVIGVEFLEPSGQWVVTEAAAPERTILG
ncbi:MAG TPA: PilZ domain-containing protein [Candidatus Acidoferrales bacterium]|nr:PilZ domain-containing protein [Candidatus Acidoferrales bacterium]